MKQFSLEEYLKDTTQKVVTRDGRSARIVCMDYLKRGYPVLALVLNNNDEFAQSCTKDGEYSEGLKQPNDLFFADKETYRPYANADECFKDVIKHGGWVKNTDGEYLHILAVVTNEVYWPILFRSAFMRLVSFSALASRALSL